MAASIDPSDEPVQAELRYVEGILRNNKAKYGDDRRAELEARTKENASYGLNREEIELLWECGIMPWDDYVDVRVGKRQICLTVVRKLTCLAGKDYLDAARGLDDDEDEDEDGDGDGLEESSIADLSRMITALRVDPPGQSELNSSTIQGSPSQKTGPKPRQRKKADKASAPSQPRPATTGPQTRHDLTQCQQCWASKSEGVRFQKCAKCLNA